MSTISRVTIIGLFGALFACGGAEDGGTTNLDASAALERIVGGAAFTGLPGVGSITLDGENYCTGTLISSRRVVTAAHCLSEYSATSFRFAIGATSDSPTKTYNVKSGAQNPNWDSDTLLGDIAYLDLTTDATETPLKVLKGMDSTWVNVDLTFVGYGYDDGQRQSGNGVKRSVVMPISEMGDSQFAYETAGKNTCNGDSGGPAFFIDPDGNYLLAGTTSYGDTYCTEYGVDTIVENYASWLGVSTVEPSNDGGDDDDEEEEEDDDDDTTTTGCGDETYVGRCDGDVVHWCENDTQYQVDCSTRNKTCVYSSPDGYYGCAENQDDDDPCDGETYKGRCDGTTVIWCEDKTVKSLACGDYDGTCGYDSSREINNCLY